MQRLSPEILAAGIQHLQAADPVMRKVIEQVGPCTIRLESNRFRSLVRAVVAQQISTKAARSIQARLEALLAPGKVTAEAIVRLAPEELRGAGLSPQKVTYVRDLADKVLAKQVRLSQLGRLSDEDVIAQLVQVKGIGVWTAQMFLIFSLGRPDVFAHADLGIRMAQRNLYGLPELPDKETSHRLAEPWRPYASVASWYCWRSGEIKA
jgi:DNA-3-methyladenine glycosylase II